MQQPRAAIAGPGRSKTQPAVVAMIKVSGREQGGQAVTCRSDVPSCARCTAQLNRQVSSVPDGAHQLGVDRADSSFGSTTGLRGMRRLDAVCLSSGHLQAHKMVKFKIGTAGRVPCCGPAQQKI